MKIALGAGRRPLVPWSADASFAADFARAAHSRDGKFVPPQSTFSVARNSIKWAQGADGTWRQFGANEPALTALGLSLEAQGTNLVPNSGYSGAEPSATDALDGLPTGWDRAKIDGSDVRGRLLDEGTLLGLPALSIRLWGNANLSDAEIRWFTWGALASNMAAEPGDTLRVSFVIARIAGSMDNISPRMRITERDSGGSYLVKQTESFAPGVSPDRIDHGFIVLDPDTVRVAAGLEFAFSGSFDVTFSIAAVQIEKNSGPAPGSPIITYGAPATRAADTLTLHLPASPTTMNFTTASGGGGAIAGQSGECAYDSGDFGAGTLEVIIGHAD